MSRYLRMSFIFGAMLPAACCASIRPAAAAMFVLSTPSGATTGGEAIGAEAWVTTGANSVSIQIVNTETSIGDMGQVLTGLQFALSNGATNGTIISSSADVVRVNSDGTVTDLGTNPISGNITIGGQAYSGWTLGSGPNLSVFGSGGPNFGGLDNQSSYDVNRSIAANGPHNPFSRGLMTFVMNVAGVTSATQVTNGTFQFGTNQNGGLVTFVHDDVTPVPEPASLVYLCSLGGVGIGYRRLSRKPRAWASRSAAR